MTERRQVSLAGAAQITTTAATMIDTATTATTATLATTGSSHRQQQLAACVGLFANDNYN